MSIISTETAFGPRTTGRVFEHAIRWKITKTPGYIVQHITKEVTWASFKGGTLRLETDSYWEAWAAPSPSSINPDGVLEGHTVHDLWKVVARGNADSTGEWTMTGTVYWMSPASFNSGAWMRNPSQVGGAGQLFYRLDHPSPKELGNPILVRRQSGTWEAESAPKPALFSLTKEEPGKKKSAFPSLFSKK